MKLFKFTIAVLATASMCHVAMASSEELAPKAPEFQYWVNDDTGEVVKVNQDESIIEKIDPSTITIKNEIAANTGEESLSRPWGRWGGGYGRWGRWGGGYGRWGRWGGGYGRWGHGRWWRRGWWRPIYSCDPYAYPGDPYYCY